MKIDFNGTLRNVINQLMREFLNQTESIRESLKQTRTRFQELIQVGTGSEEEPVFDTHP